MPINLHSLWRFYKIICAVHRMEINIMKKQNKHFDEYELILRNKIMAQTLFVVYALVIINFFIAMFYRDDWAPVSVQSMVLIFTSTCYFITASSIKNVYFGRNYTGTFFLSLIWLAAGVFNLFAVISRFSIYGMQMFIENGVLTENVSMLLTSIFFTYCGILFIITTKIRNAKEKKENEDTEN